MHTIINAQFVFVNNYFQRISEKEIKQVFQNSLKNVTQSRNLYDDFPESFNEKGDAFIGFRLITYGNNIGTIVSMYGNLRCYEFLGKYFIEFIQRALTKISYSNLLTATVLIIDETCPEHTTYMYKFNGNTDKKLCEVKFQNV